MPCRNVGTATQASCQTCSYAPGVRYYTTVHATNGAGLITSVTSDGVMYDNTKPVSGQISEGATNDIDFISNTDPLVLSWTIFTDAESGVRNCTASITDGSTTVWSASGLNENTTQKQVRTPLPTGRKLFSHISCSNNADLTNTATSDGLTIDNTPPQTGTVHVQTVTKGAIRVFVEDFSDPETQLASFDVVVRQSNVAESVFAQNRTTPNDTLLITNTNLTEGETFTITIVAYNRAGQQSIATSAPFVFDTTPPDQGAVIDGDGLADIDYQNHTRSLSAQWPGVSDSQSTIAEYAWAIGTTPGGTQAMSYQLVGLSTQATCRACPLVTGSTYYTTVRAKNTAGLFSWHTSDGVTVDTTPPVAGRINDGGQVEQDKHFQAVKESLSCSWNNFTDNDSPIVSYQVCAGTAFDRCDVVQWVTTGLTSTAEIGTAPDLHNQRVFCLVRGLNAAGLSTIGSSDGAIIDSTPPTIGTVKDGNGLYDIDCQENNKPITATWQGFSDPESTITEYQWAIGTMQFSEDILPWTSVGLQETATATPVVSEQQAERPIYVSVRAINGAGIPTEAASDGIQLLKPDSSEIPKLCVSLDPKN